MRLKIRDATIKIVTAGVLSAVIGAASASAASAGEMEAKSLLKAMSDYLGAQQTISFEYDTDLGVVTKDQQKLDLASSGTVTLGRPDKIRATRTGGFADVELIFDGKTLTLLGKNANVYSQLDVPGSLDHLIDELRDKYQRPLPGADLLLSNVYDQLMPLVVDVKDLGSGVVTGVECDHLAFRTTDVDWQIWIAQGDRPYPCRYVITSKKVEGFPEYSVAVRNWKTGADVGAVDFSFTSPANAKSIAFSDLPDTDELPSMFKVGGTK